MIVLDEALVNSERREHLLVVTFKEEAALVAEDFGLDDQCPVKGRFQNFQCALVRKRALSASAKDKRRSGCFSSR